jgi:hypothetical protein
MNEGLVAKSWSDSGDVPVGEVTYTYGEPMTAEEVQEIVRAALRPIVAEFVATHADLFIKPSDPNAKPSNPALCRVAGEAYRGLGWCDE